MPQSLSKVYVHITFSTKNRENRIDDKIETPLFEYIGGICKQMECNPIKVGGHQNHIHILCLLSRKVAQMTLLENVKKSSSKWVKTQGDEYSNFYWQDGYGIFSINPTEIDVVEEYIKNLKEHHKKKSFQDEFRAFLKKYNVDYDERYVWD
ncbi:MAG: IS200/IS605 family transposase [Bacteroidetes bacterium]|nr:MAG: IS200/IS605 family transposase [Bacteroidota bacterium]